MNNFVRAIDSIEKEIMKATAENANYGETSREREKEK